MVRSLPLRWLYVLFDFLIFMCGLRLHRSQEKLGVWADLGFIGDLLVGVGTGIIAKCGLAIMESPSDFAGIFNFLACRICRPILFTKEKRRGLWGNR